MASQAGNDVRELASYIFRYWLIILIGGILGALLYWLTFILVIPPMYTAEVQIRISASLPSKVNTYQRLNLEDINAAKARASTCVEVLKEPSLYNTIIRENNLSYTVNQLQKKVSISRKADTEIISLKVTSKTSLEAENLARMFGLKIPVFLNFSLRGGSASVVSPSIIALQEERSSLLLLAVGFVGGISVLVAVLVLVKMILDLVISHDALIQQYGSPVFAEIPKLKVLRKQAVLNCAHTLQSFSSGQSLPSVIRIVEIGKRNNRSSVCYNIALAASKNSHVLLIDLDSSPSMPSIVEIQKKHPNISIYIAPLEQPVHELLEKSQTKFSHILIKDSFRKGSLHTGIMCLQ